MWPRRVRSLVCILVGAVALVVGCNDLLGTRDPTLRDGDSDGGASGNSTAVCCDDGGCAPVNATAENCGVCGHSCLGGACEEGRCAPSILVGSQGTYHGFWSPYGLAILGETLYGTNWYSQDFIVHRASTSQYSADFTRVFPAAPDAGHAAANAIIADDYYGVYFAINKDVDSTWAPGVYLLDGETDAGPIATTPGVDFLAIDSVYLYWGTSAGSIWRASKDGSNATEFPVGLTTALVAKDGVLYYVSSSLGLVAAPPFDPTMALATYSGSTHVDSFAVGSSFVFWADCAAQRVYRAPLTDPGTPENITPSGLAFPRTYVGVLTDDEHVFLNNTDIGPPTGSTFYRLQPDGSGFEVMASVGDAVFPIVQDSTALYFATYGVGTGESVPPYAAVWKLAK